MEAGEAAFDDVEDVANDGPSGAGDDPDTAGEARERALAGRVEEAFGGEFRLEFFEGGLESARADGLYRLNDQLILAAGFVYFDATADKDFGAVLRLELQKAISAFPAGGAERGAVVLEREIGMPGSGEFQAGDFAANPDAGVGIGEQFADFGREFADGIFAAVEIDYLVHREIQFARLNESSY